MNPTQIYNGRKRRLQQRHRRACQRWDQVHFVPQGRIRISPCNKEILSRNNSERLMIWRRSSRSRIPRGIGIFKRWINAWAQEKTSSVIPKRWAWRGLTALINLHYRHFFARVCGRIKRCYHHNGINFEPTRKAWVKSYPRRLRLLLELTNERIGRVCSWVWRTRSSARSDRITSRRCLINFKVILFLFVSNQLSHHEIHCRG